MSAVTDRPRVLTISSEPTERASVLVAVRGHGHGTGSDTGDRIFDPFFTTKADGMGIGLSICRRSSRHTPGASGHPRVRRMARLFDSPCRLRLNFQQSCSPVSNAQKAAGP